MLLLSGCMTDRNVALRHADGAIEALYEISGLSLADRMKRWSGRLLGLGLGVSLACVRWLFRRSPRGPSPVWALENIFVSVGFAASVHSLSWNVAAMRRILPIVEPLEAFGKSEPYAVYLLARNLVDFPLGLFRTIRENTRRILDILGRPRRFRLAPINELDLRTGEAGARFMRALIEVSEQNPAYEDEIRELDKLDLRFFELGALQARIAFHRCRGEEALATEHERMAEILLVRLGSAWQMEAWLAVVSSLAYGLTRDALGLKRSIARLGKLVDDGFCFDAALELARGEYLRERRELSASEEALERALELAGEDLRLARIPALAALAETLLAKGELTRAEEVARRAVLEASDPESGQPVNRLRALRCQALVEAEQGQLATAATRLEHAIEEATPMGSPSVLGPLHEARASIAEREDDVVSLRWHASQASRWYLPTDNQVLVARAERLEARVARRDSVAPKAGDSADAPTVVDAVTPATAPGRSELLSDCRGASERAERVLALLADAAGAERGYLYLLRGDVLELEAPRVGREPPVEVADRLGKLVEAELLGEQISVPHSFESVGTETPGRFEPVVLRLRFAGRSAVLGVAALLGKRVARPPDGLVATLAREMYEAGDVSLGSSPREIG
jgi:tetratricopeptide (TPR) repeat protein